MTRFDSDTALVVVGEGVFEGRIDPAWKIIRGANGGHLAAIVLRAMTMAVDDADRSPRSLTVHFTRVPDEAPVRIEAAIERSGRSLSTISARMRQDDKLIAIGIGAFSLPRSGPEFADLNMPEVPAPEQLERIADRDDFPFGHHFDVRVALGPEEPDEGGRAETGVWIRLREPQVVDHIVATQLLDAWAPAVFVKLGTGGGGAGVPTIEMTHHFREVLPPPDAKPEDWYLGVYRTSTARGGFVEEDGWLWSRRGTLVAQSRQLAILMA